MSIPSCGRAFAGFLVFAVALAAQGQIGSLDLGFEPLPGPNTGVNCPGLQADGKVLIGGAFTSVDYSPHRRVARINTDGTVDASFLDPGLSGVARAFAIQVDGKVIIGGEFPYLFGGGTYGVARLDTNGRVDTNFNAGAMKGNNSPYSGPDVYSLAMQADGKILIGGTFTNVGGFDHR